MRSASDAARIISLNRSNGGVPKLPVTEARVGADGMEGDRQRNLKYHGGPDRALTLYAAELIDALRDEGHAFSPGAAGENVTISGLDWAAIVPGVRLRLGEVEVEITDYADPCRTLVNIFSDHKFSRVGQKRHPGWSRVCARVLKPGTLRVGDCVERLA